MLVNTLCLSFYQNKIIVFSEKNDDTYECLLLKRWGHLLSYKSGFKKSASLRKIGLTG